jgi:PAS domain S-box-containing protein
MTVVAEKISISVIPFRILLPVVITVILFVGTIFQLILPIQEKRMMADRRIMIRELTETAWSILQTYHQSEHSGRLSRSQAQRSAIERLREVRYGPEFKDYFWINDMHPRLIMHPYRTDLEGHDISDFADPNGKRLFVEFVQTVQTAGAGYVDYQWQWKDDPLRIVPKISYVKGFEPWGWIIGTGIYVEDVRAEIAALSRKLIWICLGILLLIVGLSSYIVWQGATTEHRRRKTDSELRISEGRYRLLAETASEYIIVFNLKDGIEYANRAWLVASGFSAENLKDRPILELLPLEAQADFNRRIDRRLSGDRQRYLYETEFLTADGQRIPVEVTSAPLLGQGAGRVLLTARDITEKRRAETQARLHREQLFQADKMATLGTLVSGVAHEINNPISFITLNTPILKKSWEAVLPILDDHRNRRGDFKVGQMDYSQLRQRLPQLVANIAEGAQRVKSIVGDLKDFARQEPSRMDDQVDINQAAAKAITLLGNLIKKSSHFFSVLYGENIPTFTGSVQKIEQVIINLLVNACQSLPNPHHSVSLHTRYDATRKQVVVEVRDQGSGIAKELLQRIRDPFFTTKRKSGGTGLGLSIAERIVEDHHGEMRFASQLGQGTTVTVRLPLDTGMQGSNNGSTRKRPINGAT